MACAATSMQALQRPIVIQSQFIRAFCPPKSRRKSPSLRPSCYARPRQHSLSTLTVTDDHIAELAAKPLHPLTLADLVKHGRPPLSAQALFSSANFTLSILPARLAHRIQSLRNLPFIVVSNPHVTKIHNNYLHSLSTLLPWAEKEIRTLEDEIKFTEVMADLVQTHSNTISILARGFLEARKYISPREVTRFLDEHLRARIGTRLIAEQHIALHFSSQPHHELRGSTNNNNNNHNEHSTPHPDSSNSSYIGIIDTQLCPAAVIRHCEAVVGDICELNYGVRPTLRVTGEPGYTFAHIPVHLEYIMTELLKNAFRATVERGMEREPIEVTIAPLPEGPSPDGADKGISNVGQGNVDEASKALSMEKEKEASEGGQSKGAGAAAVEGKSPDIGRLEESTPGVTIRIRDRGGGISPENLKHIWDYSFTTFDEEQVSSTLSSGGGGGAGRGASGMDALSRISAGGNGASSLAGLGYGLPLSRAYAEYFGGGIAVQSLWGWGTDVYLSLRGVGKVEGVA